jgi:tetratricopeptide (TPR) repeat protein
LDPTRQRDIAISHERIGDALFELKQTSEARAEYEISLKIRRELLSSQPSSVQFRADLAVAYDRIGRTAPEAGLAEEVYRNSLSLRAGLVAQQPNNPAWLRDLAASHDNVAMTLHKQGKTQEAIDGFRRSLEIREGLSAREPGTVRWQINVVRSLVLLAEAGDQPRERLERALDIILPLQSEGRLPAKEASWPELIKQYIADAHANQ